MNDDYFTVECEAAAEYTEKRSKFLARLYPVQNEEEAVQKINTARERYWDASHNVYAYILKGENFTKRFSDDGEPQGTAGIPVLDVLEKNSLFNVCLIVTRYFGGVLLGAPGLVRAYGKSASLCVENAKVICMKYCMIKEIILEYHISGKVLYSLKNENCIITDIDYGQNVKILCGIPMQELGRFDTVLMDSSGGTAIVSDVGFMYIT